MRNVAALGLISLALIAGCDRGSHPGQVATAAPNVSITDNNRTIRLSDYRGKVVVLNFWASWCTPCLEEFPSLIQLQKQMPQIQVLAVAFDDDETAYKQYLIDNHIDLVTIFDRTNKSSDAFGTSRPPETYIIDPQGKIRRKFIGPVDWSTPEIVNYLKNI